MTNDAFNCSSASQESQYALPYHYIPSLKDGQFKQHLYWSWGYRYIGGINLVLDILQDLPFESLADIGCGDGRFLQEASRRFSGKMLTGLDCSERAINMAKALNPHIHYECMDICTSSTIDHLYDVVTLIEVLEHIQTDRVDDFVSACANLLGSNGKLILTVPHKNKPLQIKHCRHFDSHDIRMVLAEHFEIDRIIFFDKMSAIWARLIAPLFGNFLFVLNNRCLLRLLYGVYQKFFFHTHEHKCGRLCVMAHKK